MSRKKANIPEGEEKDARFRRVSEPRILRMLGAVSRVTNMAKQPSYTIFDTDAQKVLDLCAPVLNEFLETFRNIAENKTKSEETIDHVF